MGKSELAFTCIKTKSVIRQVNKGSDMPVLVKFLKHCHFLRVLHFTVILLNIRAQLLFYCFASAYATKHLLLLQIQKHIQKSVKRLRWKFFGVIKAISYFWKNLQILDVCLCSLNMPPNSQI